MKSYSRDQMRLITDPIQLALI